MKKKREHHVPLSDAAVSLLKALPRLNDVPCLFPAVRGGKLSDMALSMLVRRINGEQPTFVDSRTGEPVVPHGFRATFRDWAGEATAHPREVIEHALAHQLADKAEAAYQRGSLFPKRVLLMADWATYCDRLPTVGSNVVPMAQARG
jgi:integrase